MTDSWSPNGHPARSDYAEAGDTDDPRSIDDTADDHDDVGLRAEGATEQGPRGQFSEATAITDSGGTSDVDIELLDSIEEELDEVERTLTRLDDDGS